MVNVSVGSRCNDKEPLKGLEETKEGELCHLDVSKGYQFPGIKSTLIPSTHSQPSDATSPDPSPTKLWAVLLFEGEPHILQSLCKDLMHTKAGLCL